tara:strand:+ start:5923 stop:6522 length:600 start_codon:yes stop_codon:yes gene_type:complete
MLRNIPIQLQGSCVGPINKVLNADNHDFMGNALGPTRQQIHDGTHGAVIYIANTLVLGSLIGGFSNFTLSGTTYVVSSLQVVYFTGSFGAFPYALLATNTSSSESATILTDIQNSGLDETMGIEFTGSRGTETYYATSDNKWQASSSYVDRIALPLKNSNTTSGLDDNSFLAWEANSAYWGRTGSHNQTDTTSVATLLT